MQAARPRAPRFLRARCNDCGNEQMIYSHASSVVKCVVCDKTLAVPSGGKAKMKTMILGAG